MPLKRFAGKVFKRPRTAKAPQRTVAAPAAQSTAVTVASGPRGAFRDRIRDQRRARANGTAPQRTRNRLAGAAAVNSTGPAIDDDPSIPWPDEFKYTFAISMPTRPERWEGLKARFGKWAGKVRYWRATNGANINKRKWAREGKIVGNCPMGRGQIGCHDSHVRIWAYMVTKQIPYALIMEDDANIRHRWDHYNRMRATLDELNMRDPAWDMLYVGTGANNPRRAIGPNLGRCRGCQGLFAYVLTLSGAKKLMRHARPYRIPVDVLVGNLADNGTINAYCMHPRLCYVVPVRSDTAGIQ